MADIEWLTAAVRARPGVSEVGWLGQGAGRYEDIVWRDSNFTMPTREECITAWEEYEVEKAAELAEAEAKRDDFAEVVGEKANLMIVALGNAVSAVDSDLTIINGTPNNAQVIAIVKRVLEREKSDYQLTQLIVKAFALMADIVAA